MARIFNNANMDTLNGVASGVTLTQGVINTVAKVTNTHFWEFDTGCAIFSVLNPNLFNGGYLIDISLKHRTLTSAKSPIFSNKDFSLKLDSAIVSINGNSCPVKKSTTRIIVNVLQGNVSVALFNEIGMWSDETCVSTVQNLQQQVMFGCGYESSHVQFI